jgi:hypothetical protein
MAKKAQSKRRGRSDVQSAADERPHQEIESANPQKVNQDIPENDPNMEDVGSSESRTILHQHSTEPSQFVSVAQFNELRDAFRNLQGYLMGVLGDSQGQNHTTSVKRGEHTNQEQQQPMGGSVLPAEQQAPATVRPTEQIVQPPTSVPLTQATPTAAVDQGTLDSTLIAGANLVSTNPEPVTPLPNDTAQGVTEADLFGSSNPVRPAIKKTVTTPTPLPIYKGDEKSPFVKTILETPIPADFELPKMRDFDGKGDPEMHVDKFRMQMKFKRASDEVCCLAFEGTLFGAAKLWFRNLQPGSIHNFEQLSS